MSRHPIRRFRFGRPDLDHDVEEELAHHLDLLTDELIADGLEPHVAREEAERRFGDVDAYRRSCRAIGERRYRARRRREWSLGLRSDLRLAARTLTRSPGYAAVAIATLALGIGATTLLTSIVDTVLLSPLAYPEPDRLMVIHETNGEHRHVPATPANFVDWRERGSGFEHMAALAHTDVTLTGSGDPQRLRAVLVTEGFFDVLGLPPFAGRLPSAEEFAQGAKVGVLSHGMWQNVFGGDLAVVGSTIELDGESHSVIGVLPAGFDFPKQARLWLPYPEFPADARGAHYLSVVGRLRPGISAAAATAELETVAEALSAEYPDTNEGYGVNPMPLGQDLVEDVRPMLWTLLAAVAAVLAIGCVNVANLTLARASRRRQELAVRGALGCGSGRLVRLLMTESLVVAVAGGLAGVALTWAGLRFGLRLVPAEVPRLDLVSLDFRLLGFAGLISISTGLVCGFLPAWRIARGDLGTELGSGRTPSLRGRAVAPYLVATEVALALVMVLAAGLLLRSFTRVLAIDGGFDPENVLTAQVQLSGEKYEDKARQSAFFEELVERVEGLPGVRSAAVIPWLPLEPGWNLGFRIDGQPAPKPGETPWAETRWTSARYFETLGIPVLAGRSFDEGDRADAVPVVVVNEELMRVYFNGENPIGRILHYDVPRSDERTPRRIVGVVGDVRQWGLTSRVVPTAYIPQAQEPFSKMRLAVKTSTPPLELAGAVRREIWAMDPLLAVDDVTTMEKRYRGELVARRFTLQLISGFALIALGLAALGIYGLIAQMVTRRTAEIGVRVALGASSGDVLRWALGHGMKMVAVGAVVGLLGAAASTRLLESLLYETSTTDPLTFAAVVAVLVGVALLACLVPARRATRVDPVVALRSD